MKPEDDPEARIRELERPFSHIAKTSELGVGQEGGPQVTGPPVPKRTGRGLFVGVAALGLVAIAVGVVAYNATSGVTTTTPTRASGGGGTIDTTTAGTPAEGAVEPAPSVEAKPPGESGDRISISGVGGHRTLACNDGVVSISGVSNVVTLTGHCASLEVSGVSNVITVDSSTTINASGFDNRITFRSGQPEIGNSGSGNIVERG